MECIMLFNVRHLDLKVLEALQILVLRLRNVCDAVCLFCDILLIFLLLVLLRNGEVSVPP